MSSTVYTNNNLFGGNDINGATTCWRELKRQLKTLGYELTTADNNDLMDCAGIIFCDAFSLGEPPSFGIKSKNPNNHPSTPTTTIPRAKYVCMFLLIFISPRILILLFSS